MITEREVGLNKSAGARDSTQLPQSQDVSDLGSGHVQGGPRGEAADDHVVDDEGEAAHPEQAYESLYEADTEGDGRDNL